MKTEPKTPEPSQPRIRRATASDCATCTAHQPNTVMPPHDASERCESGKHNHCTCDTCF